MRYLYLLPLITCVLPAAAQDRMFYGRVTDDSRAGVPFAVVEAKGRGQGVYCNEQGIFSFRANADSVKTLAIYCLGYGQREVPAATPAGDSIMITLQRKTATLQEVAIRATKGREAILGKPQKKLSYTGNCYRYYGSETAILLKAGQHKEGVLKDVYVYITNDGDYTTKFRVHVYEWDSTTAVPAREVTDSNVIAMAVSGNTWVKIELGNKRIPVNDGLFVSVEWVAGFGNNKKKLQSALNPEVTDYNGQVPGLTGDYGRESITYSRKPFRKEWEYYNPADARRKAGHFLNPMIYCTYVYYK